MSEARGWVWRTDSNWLSASTQRTCHYGNKVAGCSQSIAGKPVSDQTYDGTTLSQLGGANNKCTTDQRRHGRTLVTVFDAGLRFDLHWPQFKGPLVALVKPIEMTYFRSFFTLLPCKCLNVCDVSLHLHFIWDSQSYEYAIPTSIPTQPLTTQWKVVISG